MSGIQRPIPNWWWARSVLSMLNGSIMVSILSWRECLRAARDHIDSRLKKFSRRDEGWSSAFWSCDPISVDSYRHPPMIGLKTSTSIQKILMGSVLTMLDSLIARLNIGVFTFSFPPVECCSPQMVQGFLVWLMCCFHCRVCMSFHYFLYRLALSSSIHHHNGQLFHEFVTFPPFMVIRLGLGS